MLVSEIPRMMTHIVTMEFLRLCGKKQHEVLLFYLVAAFGVGRIDKIKYLVRIDWYAKWYNSNLDR